MRKVRELLTKTVETFLSFFAFAAAISQRRLIIAFTTGRRVGAKSMWQLRAGRGTIWVLVPAYVMINGKGGRKM